MTWSNIQCVISLWEVFVTIIPWQRQSLKTFQPGCWTPSIPDCWLDIEWYCVPDFDVVTTILIGLMSEHVVPEKVRTRQSNITEEVFACSQ